MVSTRRWTAPVLAARSRARVVLPVAGRPPMTISMPPLFHPEIPLNAVWPEVRIPPPKATYFRPFPRRRTAVQPRPCGPSALSPAHDRGFPRTPRGVQAHTDEVAAALHETGPERDVVRSAPVVPAGEVAGFSVPLLEDDDDGVAVAEGAHGVLAGLRRFHGEVGLLTRSEPERRGPEGHQRRRPDLLGRRGPAQDVLLVGGRQRARRVQAPAELLRLQDQPRLEGVLHDRLRVPDGAVHLVRVELAQDVEERPVPAPEVRRARQIGVDGLVVPVDPGERTLVLVQHAERVPDLVQGRPALPGRGQVPAEVHGALVLTDEERVLADGRPGAVADLEPDPQFGLRTVTDLGEAHPDPEVLPLLEALAHHVPLFLGADPRHPTGLSGPRNRNDRTVGVVVEEAVVQDRAVDPHPA